MSRVLPVEVLADQLSTFLSLSVAFPPEDHVATVVPPSSASAADVLQRTIDFGEPLPPDWEKGEGAPLLEMRLKIGLAGDKSSSLSSSSCQIVVEVTLPLVASSPSTPNSSTKIDDVAPPSPQPLALNLLRPAWITDDAAFARLVASLPPPSRLGAFDSVSDLVEHLQSIGPDFIPDVARTTHKEEEKGEDATAATMLPAVVPPVGQVVLAVSKMHHIVNLPKLRRLKAAAVAHGASGFYKAGHPGILFYEIEEQALPDFLTSIKALKYLEFHHLASTPLQLPPSSLSSSSSAASKKSVPAPQPRRLIEDSDRAGLREVEQIKQLVEEADRVGRRTWFRDVLGLAGS